MNREELKRYVGITGYSMGQVEKDYFQHMVLSALSREMASILVFKGGTALQKAGIISRFSEDLDFTARGVVRSERLVQIAVNVIRNYNYHADIDNVLNDERTTGFRLRIEGPLFRNNRGICTIRIEVSKRETVVMDPERKEFSPPYVDILPYVMDIMHEEEMLAEKVRAIYTRQKSRDLYDLHRLLERGTVFDTDLANRKLEYYDLRFDHSTFIGKCERLQPGWNAELGNIMVDIPPFRTVLELAVEKTA